MENNNQNFWNSLNLYATFLQIMGLALLQSDASNNELMRELQRQDREYLDKIVKQNEEIIRLLKNNSGA